MSVASWIPGGVFPGLRTVSSQRVIAKPFVATAFPRRPP